MCCEDSSIGGSVSCQPLYEDDDPSLRPLSSALCPPCPSHRGRHLSRGRRRLRGHLCGRGRGRGQEPIQGRERRGELYMECLLLCSHDNLILFNAISKESNAMSRDISSLFKWNFKSFLFSFLWCSQLAAQLAASSSPSSCTWCTGSAGDTSSRSRSLTRTLSWTRRLNVAQVNISLTRTSWTLEEAHLTFK